MDVRPGGTCEFVMVSLVTVTLGDLGDRTEMTCHVVGETSGDQAVAGWSSSFDKLAESLTRA